jgi:hypothetical protein
MGVSAATAILIGSGVSAVGAISGGQAAGELGEQQAAISAEQALQEKLLTEAEVRDFARNQSRVFGERRAALGASGIDPSTGSAVLAAEDFAAEVELNKRRIQLGGEVRATRLEQQADLQRQAGRAAKTAGFFRGGASLLTGIGASNQFGAGAPPSHGGRDFR